MKRSSATLAIALLAMSTAAWAQSKSAPAAAKPAPTPPSLGPSPTASRVLGPKSDEFIESMSAALSIRNRDRDAFAKHQEIQAPKAAAPKVATGPATAPVARTTLDEVVAPIKVNQVSAAEKRFWVGSRNWAVGDTLTLVFNNTNFEVKVAEVTSERIVFINPATNEVGTKNLNATPLGVIKGMEPSGVKGLTKPGDQGPLNIGSGR